jgi:nucleoside-diphosphate-sugar epimerase
MSRPGRVAIVGASGLVGTAAANSFLDAGWDVTAISRRRPALIHGDDWRWLTLDLTDADACRAAAGDLNGVTHLVYTAVYELPGLVAGWQDPVQIETNGRMFENLLDPLLESLTHVTLLQGTKAYGSAVKPMRVPARESQPRVPHPNFYWLQEDHLKVRAAEADLGYTVLRPQLIVGPNHGVVMNLPPVIGAYAAIRQHEGLPFSFPGGAEWVWEAVDVRLVGDACLWAATHDVAWGETFNLTNGEVFSFRDMWPALANALRVRPGPDEPLKLAEYLPERAVLWDEIVARHGLQPIPLPELLGESHHYADLCLATGTTEPPPPVFVSTVKVRQAGFDACYDTEQSFCYWLDDLIARRVLPKLDPTRA